MEELFLKILNMSITASWITFVILIFRPFFQKVSKRLFCFLWIIVALRLVFPFSFESPFSLIPSAETVSPEIMLSPSPEINSGFDFINSSLNPIISESFSPDPFSSANPLQILTFVFSFVWLSGVAVMILYFSLSYFFLSKKVKESIRLKENIFLCDRISSPFICGVFKPKIFLPSSMNEKDYLSVIAHEKAHIERKDNLWKPLGFFILAVHWFNPVMWLAYHIFCKDVELACDERVIRKMSSSERKEYSLSLLSLSVSSKRISPFSSAFGEIGVKGRIKSVLKYKKPVIWALVFVLVISIISAFCFLTNPAKEAEIISERQESPIEDVSIKIKSIDENSIRIIWENNSNKELGFGNPFQLFRKEEEELYDCCMIEEMVHTLPLYLLRSGEKIEKDYSLKFFDLSSAGEYRFLTDVVDLENNNSIHDIFIDFEIDEPIATTDYEEFIVTDWIYSNGIFSFIPSFNGDSYRVLDEKILQKYSKSEEKWKDIALGAEVELNEETFDSRFSPQLWQDGYSLKKLRSGNRKLLQFKTEENKLCLIMLQKNGDIYFSEGYCEMEGMKNPQNNDRSMIRFVYQTFIEKEPELF